MSCICGHAPSFCQQCIDKGIKHHRSLKATLQSQVDEVTARCERHVTRQTPWRELRAEVARLECSVAAKKAKLKAIQEELARSSNARTATKAERPATRSDTATLIKAEMTHVRRQQRNIDSRMIAARQVLVKEAAAVMGLKRWEIAGLALPPVKEIRLHQPAFINAAMQHTLQLLDLFTRYLSVSLPFEPETKKRTLIVPNVPFINTTKYRDRTLYLHLSRNQSSGQKSYRSFITSYALLSHSIAYLAWTQGAAEERDIGGNLVNLVDSPSLGFKSHLGPKRMRNMAFSLDVHDVVAQVLAEAGISDKDEWELIDAPDT